MKDDTKAKDEVINQLSIDIKILKAALREIRSLPLYRLDESSEIAFRALKNTS